MKLQWVFSFALALLLILNGHPASGATNNLASVHTNLVADTSLSTNELADLVKFANACGMNAVAEVKTFNHRPGARYHGILLTGPEKIDGRTVSFQTMNVHRDGWDFKARPTNRLYVMSAGEFWTVGPNYVKDNKLTTFTTAKGTIRVAVSDGISMDAADKIIGVMTTGKVTYSDIYLKPWMSKFDFSRYESLNITSEDGHFWISCADERGFARFELILNGDEAHTLNPTFGNY
jgi:hypothetical protein